MRTVLIEKFVKVNKFITEAPEKFAEVNKFITAVLFPFAHSHNQIAPPIRVAILGFHVWNNPIHQQRGSQYGNLSRDVIPSDHELKEVMGRVPGSRDPGWC